MLTAQVKKPNPEDPAAAEAPAEPAPLGYLPDLLADNQMLEWAGLGFGEEESYLLSKALKVIRYAHRQRLAVKVEPKSLRLWGKIYGTEADYYVAEGEKEAAAGSAEPPPDVEPRGSGVNRCAYWVTNSVVGEWIELPDATPATIRVARQLRHIFTGRPNAEVICNPFFSGKEKELLRAQIARISQATTIEQRGLHKRQEENDKEIIDVPEEEKKQLAFEQLISLDSWCHLTPNILKVRDDLDGVVRPNHPPAARAPQRGKSGLRPGQGAQRPREPRSLRSPTQASVRRRTYPVVPTL